MIISRTPFRVSFLGGGTDFPDFYSKHGGAAILSSIDKYCYISLHRLSPFFKYRFRASYARTELVQHHSEFQHPLIRESLGYLDIKEGLEIAHVSDLPGRTGLGTSSAFTVGLLHVLHAMQNQRVTAEDLANEAIHIERERVGDSGGHQDQYAAAYGGFMRLDFHAPGKVSVKRIPMRAARIKEFERRLMLFYTGVEQSAETILQEQNRSLSRNEAALLRMKSLVDDAERVLMSGGDTDSFGSLLNEAWQLKKGFSKGISNGAIDESYNAAMQAGALGGKLLGAGGRGFLLLYAHPSKQDGIRERLAALREVSFAFSPSGSEIIYQAPEA